MASSRPSLHDGETRRGIAPAWTLDAAIAAKIGFAAHHNVIPVIRELAVSAPPDAGANDLTLSLQPDPPFV